MNAVSRLDAELLSSNSKNLKRIFFLKEAEKYFQIRHSKQFHTAYGIELLKVDEFNQFETKNSMIFSALETVAQKLGCRTHGTMGCLTEAVGLDQQDAHRIGCACLGQTVTGEEIATRIRNRIKALQS